MQIDYLHLDDDLVVVNKPSGLAVHRGWARDRLVVMTLVRDQLGAWVYPVHRLDRGASGALLFARSSERARELSASFTAGAVEKQYGALVRGSPPDEGIIDHPIPGKEDGERVPARSRYRVAARFGRYSWVEVWTETGRLHQVRRHLKHISCPLIGDVRYGKGPHNRFFREQYQLNRLALHAQRLSFPHPRTGERIDVVAPLTDSLQATLQALAAAN